MIRWIKVVPEVMPNDDGVWIELPEPFPSLGHWNLNEEVAEKFKPDGTFIVAMATEGPEDSHSDLSY